MICFKYSTFAPTIAIRNCAIIFSRAECTYKLAYYIISLIPKFELQNGISSIINITFPKYTKFTHENIKIFLFLHSSLMVILLVLLLYSKETMVITGVDAFIAKGLPREVNISRHTSNSFITVCFYFEIYGFIF